MQELLNLPDGIEYTLSVPSVSQAKRMKALSQEKQLSPQKINEILNEIKKTDMSRVIFKNSQMYKYLQKGRYGVFMIKTAFRPVMSME